jgi:hypothetical protein
VVNESVFFNIDFKKDISIDDIFSIQNIFERLFGILLSEPVCSYKVDITSKSKTTYRLLKKYNDTMSSNFYRVPIKTFLQNSESIIDKWLSLQQELDLLFRGFFNAFGNESLLLENKFLNFIAGLEFYYGERYEESLNLKEKLRNFISNSSIGRHMDDIDTYANKLKDTRHYFAHYEKKYKSKAFNSKQLLYVNNVLQIIIRELIVTELGIDDCPKATKHMRIQ